MAQNGSWQPEATPEADATAQLLGVQYSHPPWLVQRWLHAYGQETTLRLLAGGNRCAAALAGARRQLPVRCGLQRCLAGCT